MDQETNVFHHTLGQTPRDNHTHTYLHNHTEDADTKASVQQATQSAHTTQTTTPQP